MTPDFEQLLAHSPNPYVLLDRDLTLVWMNEAYLRVTNSRRDVILGRNMFEAFPSEGESERQLRRSLEQVLRTGEPDEIAHIRYDIRNAEGGYETHYWSATHTPHRGPDGAVTHVLQHTVDITELEELRRLRDASGVVSRARAVEKRYHTANEELERFRNLLEQAPGFVAVLSGEEHRFVMANAAYRKLVGERELIGRTVSEAMPEVVEQGFIDLLDRVFATREAYLGNREPLMLVDPETKEAQEAYLEFIYQPILNRSGAISGIFVQGHNVTEEVEAEQRQRLLINELNHRVKNTLAVVQGLAQQSLNKDRGAADQGNPGLDAFAARLAALASAHNLLTEANWEAADLREIVERSLAATVSGDPRPYSLDGPPVTLPPQAAVGLSMIIHELATNALKYGALREHQGRIAIDWGMEGDEEEPTLWFGWRESGGPAVSEPARRGFGSRLIARGLGGRADRVQMDYAREGFRYRLETRI